MAETQGALLTREHRFFFWMFPAMSRPAKRSTSSTFVRSTLECAEGAGGAGKPLYNDRRGPLRDRMYSRLPGPRQRNRGAYAALAGV